MQLITERVHFNSSDAMSFGFIAYAIMAVLFVLIAVVSFRFLYYRVKALNKDKISSGALAGGIALIGAPALYIGVSFILYQINPTEEGYFELEGTLENTYVPTQEMEDAYNPRMDRMYVDLYWLGVQTETSNKEQHLLLNANRHLDVETEEVVSQGDPFVIKSDRFDINAIEGEINPPVVYTAPESGEESEDQFSKGLGDINNLNHESELKNFLLFTVEKEDGSTQTFELPFEMTIGDYNVSLKNLGDATND